MIEKSGFMYLNGKLCKKRYDRNEEYGVVGQNITFYKVVWEFKILGVKFSISIFKHLAFPKDFFTIAFDPPKQEVKNG